MAKTISHPTDLDEDLARDHGTASASPADSLSQSPKPAEGASDTTVGRVLPDATKPAATTKQAGRYVGKGLTPMPKVGLEEEMYLKVAKRAEKAGDDLLHEVAKVGQYVTLAIRRPDEKWGKKVKFFHHALKRHCKAPEHADDITKQWFKKLSTFVKHHAGQEALRITGEMDDCFNMRLEMSQSRDDIADDAEAFFEKVCPYCETCPPLYNEEDWRQLCDFRDRWV